MKIFLLNKKALISFFSIFFILILIITFHSSIKANFEKTVSNEFLNKIEHLMEGKEKICYLTFDDGPNPAITPKVLDILKEENVKATFFVIGKLVDSHPEIVKRAYEEGHYIANHGYSHNNSILYRAF